MMSIKKEYFVSDELEQLFDDYVIYTDCRDEAIRSLFRAKRAI